MECLGPGMMICKDAALCPSMFDHKCCVATYMMSGSQMNILYHCSAADAPAEKGDRAPLTSLKLFQNHTQADIQSIRVDSQRGVGMWVMLQAVGTQDFLNVEDCLIFFGRPREGRGRLAGNHLVEGIQDHSSMRDEAVIVVHQT